jgi:hypothetical protein
MEQGVILIGYDEAATDFEALERERIEWYQDDRNKAREFIPDAHRSGHFAVVRDEFITRMITPEALADQVLKVRWSFMPASIMTQLIGQPTQDDVNQKHDN